MSPMAGYPKVHNVEMDPHEDLNIGALFPWPMIEALKEVEKYYQTLKDHPNPPAANLTRFHNPPGG